MVKVGGDADDADKAVIAVPSADVNPSEDGDDFFDGLSQLVIDDDQVVLAGLEAVAKINVPAPNPDVVGEKSDALHTDEETEDTVSDTPLLDKRKRAPALKSPFVDFGSADVGSTPMELMSSGSQSAGDDRDFKMVTYVKGLYALNDAFADPVSTEIEAKFDSWIDVDEFYALCDPEKENLCLYGHPNESWDVALPAEEVPPELPEPALGINFARDGMNRKDWLSLVAVHSDSWLLSVAFYFGARLNRNERCPEVFLLPMCKTFCYLCSFDYEYVDPEDGGDSLPDFLYNELPVVNRKRLFSMINDLPTVFEVVTERKPIKEKPSIDSGSKSRGSTKRSNDGQVKSNPKLADESFEEDEDEHSETLCGSCGGNYNADEFWIGCDICEKWFHGKCVKITPAKAESIKQYKCPSCSMKRGRQ
ncbi:hypothetical protein F8388_022513 [Cannabis sativa]|uniref:PHD finger protein ALFIN-LIKE n=1 Tax=Cannabis sativa TaxID=3483 RepID=A0A7J6EKD6_CANSA|nr:hypothetical protein F8388_022513 [Cannabis sativa]